MELFNARHENLSYVPLVDFKATIVGEHLSIVNAVSDEVVVCDERQSEELLIETASLAAYIAQNKSVINFYTNRMSLFDISELLVLPDFFAKNKDHPITKQILDYHRKYGIPSLLDFRGGLFIGADSPAEWTSAYEKKERQGKKRPTSRYDDADIIIALQEKNAYPLVVSLCFFLNFYNYFIGVCNTEEICMEQLQEDVKADVAYIPEQNQLLLKGTQPGFWSASIIVAFTDKINGKIYGVCKNCRKWFILPRPNAEYCSPKCRNAYNVKKSLLRRKERERQL